MRHLQVKKSTMTTDEVPSASTGNCTIRSTMFPGPILLLAIVSLDLAPPVIDLVVVILMPLEEKATPVGVGYSGNNNTSGGYSKNQCYKIIGYPVDFQSKRKPLYANQVELEQDIKGTNTQSTEVTNTR
ncbi:hypothetical protein KY285_016460 [Solanum tuberosum]|nr:hypothetical protein KY284_016460 [Solanum tuberosum]KAH0702182.1 hypothetical protein KY285_016460 [Solanum tuberosum]